MTIVHLSTDRRSSQGHRCGFSSCKIEREVMGVTLVHDFHSESGAVEYVCPGVEHSSLSVDDGLVEVEAIEVESHGRDAEGGKPDSHHWPRSEEEMQTSRIVKRCILEDQATEVTVGGYNVIGLFFLAELVAVVLGLSFSSLTNERRRNQRTVHCREQGPTKDTCDSKHVEGVHEDVMFCLEDKHVVERARNAEWHSVRERTLTEWIDQEHCRSSGDRRRVSNTDPGAHAQAVGKFPLTTHVGVDADQEVEDDELERTAVVQPLIERSGFPDGIEMETNSVRARNNSTGDDVITIKERTSDGLTDTIDVHRRSSDEGYDKANRSSKQSRDHKSSKPADIQTVVGGGNPLAERFPSRLGLLL